MPLFLHMRYCQLKQRRSGETHSCIVSVFTFNRRILSCPAFCPVWPSDSTTFCPDQLSGSAAICSGRFPVRPFFIHPSGRLHLDGTGYELHCKNFFVIRFSARLALRGAKAPRNRKNEKNFSDVTNRFSIGYIVKQLEKQQSIFSNGLRPIACKHAIFACEIKSKAALGGPLRLITPQRLKRI